MKRKFTGTFFLSALLGLFYQAKGQDVFPARATVHPHEEVMYRYSAPVGNVIDLNFSVERQKSSTKMYAASIAGAGYVGTSSLTSSKSDPKDYIQKKISHSTSPFFRH